jgi:hypothetical protein
LWAAKLGGYPLFSNLKPLFFSPSLFCWLSGNKKSPFAGALLFFQEELTEFFYLHVA